MPRLWGGASGPDYAPSPQRPDAFDARRAAEAHREIARQSEHDPERPRSVWERRFNALRGEWEDVEIGTLPPLAGAGSERAPLEDEEQEHETEESAWLGLA